MFSLFLNYNIETEERKRKHKRVDSTEFIDQCIVGTLTVHSKSKQKTFTNTLNMVRQQRNTTTATQPQLRAIT